MARFSAKRGRPALERPKVDLGTEELQNKRITHLTAEALDFYFEQGLLSATELRVGIKFRSLFFRMFSDLSLRAFDYEKIRHNFVQTHDSANNSKDQKLYLEAVSILKSCRGLNDVINLCVFNAAVKEWQIIKNSLNKLAKIL
jgi:hypothetical protein